MRTLLLITLFGATSPAWAQQAPLQTYDGPSHGSSRILPPQIEDPALPTKLGRRAGAVTQALMNLPIGELEAAVEGRRVTPADRHRTIGHMSGPGAARHVEHSVIAQTRAMQATAQAVERATPAIQQAIGQILASLDAVAADLPSRDYPRR